jgi:hypothetical protein
MTTTSEPTTATFDALGVLAHRLRSRAMAPPDAPPGAYLVARTGVTPWLLRLHLPVIRIGRAFDSDIELDDHTVSRRHAMIVRRAGALRLLDDRSANGTFLNGRRIDDAPLADGDLITVGRVALRFLDTRSGASFGARAASRWQCRNQTANAA